VPGARCRIRPITGDIVCLNLTKPARRRRRSLTARSTTSSNPSTCRPEMWLCHPPSSTPRRKPRFRERKGIAVAPPAPAVRSPQPSPAVAMQWPAPLNAAEKHARFSRSRRVSMLHLGNDCTAGTPRSQRKVRAKRGRGRGPSLGRAPVCGLPDRKRPRSVPQGRVLWLGPCRAARTRNMAKIPGMVSM